MNKGCELCSGHLDRLDSIYDRCSNCGLDIKRDKTSVEITNDALVKDEIVKLDGLTKFKLKLVKKIDPSRMGLLDIGTASGKFPYHGKKEFRSVQGIEVNKKCIEFAAKELGVDLVDSIEKVNLNPISCITLWHSLEHIPLESSREIFRHLNSKIPNVPVLVSVPNADSMQFKFFKESWPYYDRSSHIYQFSPKALIQFMNENGYALSKTKIGFMYELFGYLQGLVNLVHPIDNYFYYRSKRGWDFGLSEMKLKIFDILNLTLLALSFPVAVLLLPFSLGKKAGVINYIFRAKI